MLCAAEETPSGAMQRRCHCQEAAKSESSTLNQIPQACPSAGLTRVEVEMQSLRSFRPVELHHHLQASLVGVRGVVMLQEVVV